MERFKVINTPAIALWLDNLHSNMERFKEVSGFYEQFSDWNLHSNMERFKAEAILKDANKLPLFTFQYGEI